MKNKLILITILVLYNNSFGQTAKKDTLFFKVKSTFISSYKNYENVYSFTFKNEKLVTSAFGNRITAENLFYFVGNSFFTFKSKKVYNLKKYLRKKKRIVRDAKTKKYDSYKLMKYFNKYTVFFLMKDKFIKVKAVASLSE